MKPRSARRNGCGHSLTWAAASPINCETPRLAVRWRSTCTSTSARSAKIPKHSPWPSGSCALMEQYIQRFLQLGKSSETHDDSVGRFGCAGRRLVAACGTFGPARQGRARLEAKRRCCDRFRQRGAARPDDHQFAGQRDRGRHAGRTAPGVQAPGADRIDAQVAGPASRSRSQTLAPALRRTYNRRCSIRS